MKKVIFAATAAACLLASAAFTQPPPGRMGPPISVAMAVMPPHADMIDRMGGQLNLTEDQKAKLKDALIASDNTIKPLVKSAADACRALHDGVLANDSTPANLTGLASAASTAENAVVTSSLDTWAHVRTILTADQLA